MLYMLGACLKFITASLLFRKSSEFLRGRNEPAPLYPGGAEPEKRSNHDRQLPYFRRTF